MTVPIETMGPEAWRDVRRVLAVRLDNLGDLLMTTPALAALKRSPDTHVTLLGSRSGVAALPHLAPLHDAIVYDAPWTKGAAHAARPTADDRALIDRLVAGRYDAAIIFTVATQSALPAALLCRLAGIPLRLAHSRENPYDLLTHWVAEPDAVADGMRHEVMRQLDLVGSVGFPSRGERLRFAFGLDDALGMLDKLERAGAREQMPYILVHPGATASSRRYPPERYAAAADLIADRTGRQVVWSGGADETALVEQAQAAMRHPSVSVAGKLTLGELGALIAGADVVLCNNSAPAHLAAAVTTPVVVLYALTNPQHTPWSAHSRVLNHHVSCRHCLKSSCPQSQHLCLLGVPADAVAEAAIGLMQAEGASASDPPPLPRWSVQRQSRLTLFAESTDPQSLPIGARPVTGSLSAAQA